MGHDTYISRNNRKGEPEMNEIKTATIGKGKAVHALFTSDRTLCKRNFNVEGAALPVECDADEVTCKKCLKEIAALVEADHAEAVRMDEERTIARAYLSTPADVALTEEEIAQAVSDRHAETEAFLDDAAREQAHAEAIEENAERYGAHLVKWIGDDGKSRYCDVRVLNAGISWRDQHHEGPCYDALTETWREERKPSARQRRAERRALRASLRKAAPQMRAVARARRAKRGAARATAKTLLVAAGVPQDIAERYAPAFSRGVQAETAPARVRTGAHRSKRVDVKRYTWQQFRAQLRVYRPAALVPEVWFNEAAGHVGVLA